MQKHERLQQDAKLAISKIISEELKNPDVTVIIPVFVNLDIFSLNILSI